MFIRMDSLGHSEILNDEDVCLGDDPQQPMSYLTVGEYGHFLDLTRLFDKSYFESVATGKSFKNPLTNKDLAWLYQMAAKENPPQGTIARLWDDRQKIVSKFMIYMDNCLKTLRKKNVAILGK